MKSIKVIAVFVLYLVGLMSVLELNAFTAATVQKVAAADCPPGTTVVSDAGFFGCRDQSDRICRASDLKTSEFGQPFCPAPPRTTPEEPLEVTDVCQTAVREQRLDPYNCDCDVEPITPDNCEIVKYLEIGIHVMTGLAGLAIVGGIMTGAYMYMTARDNPGQTNAGRQRVIWALTALLILIFLWGFLQWLVPGGVL